MVQKSEIWNVDFVVGFSIFLVVISASLIQLYVTAKKMANPRQEMEGLDSKKNCHGGAALVGEWNTSIRHQTSEKY